MSTLTMSVRMLCVFLMFAVVSAVVGAEDHARQAEAILESLGRRVGLVHLPRCGDGALGLALLAADETLRVHGQDTDYAQVQAARRQADEQGVAGRRAWFDYGDVSRLLPVGNSSDLIVMSDLVEADLTPELAREIARVLHPWYGVALLGGPVTHEVMDRRAREAMTRWSALFEGLGLSARVIDNRTVRVDNEALAAAFPGVLLRVEKPAMPGADNWSHFWHGPSNNPVSTDTAYSYPETIQWTGTPLKTSKTDLPIVANGRLFMLWNAHVAGCYSGGDPVPPGEEAELRSASSAVFTLSATGLDDVKVTATENDTTVTQPIPLIYDTDMDSDVDDVAGLTVLHALADRGEVDLLGVTVSSKHDWSALCADRINTYFGRHSLPLGQHKGPGGGSRGSKYAQEIAEEFPGTLASANDVPDAIKVYREILAAQPDNSVVIVSVGYLNNLRDLLASGADEHSSLNGRDLVQQKVKVWVPMGGRLPGGADSSRNFGLDSPASQEATDQWPTEVVFSIKQKGYVKTGANILDLPTTNPVRRAYQIFGKIPHWSSDQLAALYAVRELDNPSGHFKLSDPGRISIDPNSKGGHTWEFDPHGTQRFAGFQSSSARDIVRAEVDALMMHIPAVASVPQIEVSVSSLTVKQGTTAPFTKPSLTVTQGGTADFTVSLTQAPTSDVTVTVARSSGDSDLSVSSGASLTFTPGNWNVAQTVTLAAASDADTVNGSAVFTLSANSSARSISVQAATVGLIAQYTFNEGSGSTAHDSSGQGGQANLAVNGNVEWVSDGVRFTGNGRLQADNADKINQDIRYAGTFSVALWLEPGQLQQGGPARILTLSPDRGDRNLTVGHGNHKNANNHLELRVRATNTSANGTPGVDIDDTFVSDRQHLVITFDGSVARIYRNGNLIASDTGPGGLANWNPSYPLVLGAEADGKRKWVGTLYEVGIYDQVLSAQEISDAYDAGSGTPDP